MDEETHLASGAGHDMSVDCWCEPVQLYLFNKSDGSGTVLVVRHVDNHDEPDENDEIHIHETILNMRDDAQDWITRVLDAVPTEDED